MDFAEYAAMGDRLIADIKNDPNKYLTPDDVWKYLQPGIDEFDEVNRKVTLEAIAHRRFKPAAMQAAMKRRLAEIKKLEKEQQKEQQKREAQQRFQDRANATFGGTPTSAREAVQMFTKHNGVAVRYDMTLYMHGKETLGSAVEAAIMLEAEAQGFTLGENRCMSNAAIKLAWSEFLEMARDERKDVVWQYIESTDRATADKALSQLRELCEKLFIEPEFADASIRKWIWQVKRRMARMYVRDLHFLILRGGQGTGKTELAREILRPIHEVACEATLEQILDDRNFTMRSMYAAFPDELARAERADLNAIKGVVTGESSTSRVLYSHHAQKNPINLSLIGTADKPIAEMMSDAAGMRRFIEVITKPKHLLNLDWEVEVVALPWADIWRAVDHTTDDPLMTQFGDLLREKQDIMRKRPNVESWLEGFEFEANNGVRRKDYVPGEYVEFGAKELYAQAFRQYEAQYHPGSTPTSITTWGLRFKELIESGKQPRWSHRKAHGSVLYKYLLLDQSVPANEKGLVVLHPRNKAGQK